MREDLTSEQWKRTTPFGLFEIPASPLLTHVPDALERQQIFLDGYETFEEKLQYQFKDRSVAIFYTSHMTVLRILHRVSLLCNSND